MSTLHIDLSASIGDKIAADVAPNGGGLRCEKCQRVEAISRSEVATYFRRGWPLCCEATMTFLPGVPRG